MRVFVLDKNKQSLMPCHPRRARELLTQGKAAVFRQFPWLDTPCVGDQGRSLTIPSNLSILEITATGRGCRQKCLVNRFGFPRSSPKDKKRVFGFQTGDIVSAIISSGKKQGAYRGYVAVRATGNFNIHTQLRVVQGIQAKHCCLIQRQDGYLYTHLKEERHFLPGLQARFSVPLRG